MTTYLLHPPPFLSLCSQVIILIGNKADLEAQRDVTYEEAKQFAEENGESEALERLVCFFFLDVVVRISWVLRASLCVMWRLMWCVVFHRFVVS